ncbi:DUF2399 domain-containing protein [Pseudonocardia sp. KRD291]|uniref:DUF2399 domain-containing protein n=1 Tax=Pseudonocardia sp. KRD291 TaxID=2792007 RepID=UPI001C4A66EF|nr:DUF2399 domain-containing protein [Pseudonocardia sp. KRD291]MBW0104481.1 DUF2399 domain-containing protein [Pseudonocardia sp. KRD291]
MTPRADRVAARLSGWPRRRVSLDELWGVLDDADPASRGSAERRAVLAGVVEELAAAGLLTPSAGTDGRHPPLPRSVLRAPDTGPGPPRRDVIWHHELSDAAGLHRGTDVLEQVNRWLFGGGPRADPAPLRERALEITGDEKAFDGGLGTVLTLDVLRAYRVTLPLHRASVGPGPILLVVENSDTFDSLRRVLADRPGAVGEVGWGAGAAFGSSVLSLRDDPPGALRYFGDVDAAGLRIPAAASALAEEVGLPPVRPATGLYELLIGRGAPRAGQPPVAGERADELVAWLDPPCRDRVRTLLRTGRRLAQEAVGLTALAASETWRPDLPA